MSTIIPFPVNKNSNIEQYADAIDAERLAAGEVRYAKALLDLAEELQVVREACLMCLRENDTVKQRLADRVIGYLTEPRKNSEHTPNNYRLRHLGSVDK